MIELEHVSYTYPGGERQSGVTDLNLTIPAGQVVLFCGQSGCGKTTVSRLINGLIPEYYKGELKGTVRINGTPTAETSLYELSHVVGSVFQNPRSQFFNVDTTGEIAFGCENRGLPQEEIYKRIGKAAGELKIQNLLDRSLFALSGGEKQKIACASVSAMEPDIFVLDEPSSNLDVATIEDLREVIGRWKAMGKTVILAEHRLYYLKGLADRVIYMKEGKISGDYTMEEFTALSEGTLQEMGLRGLYPSFLGKEEERRESRDFLEIQNFRLAYDQDPVVNIPSLRIPQGSIVSIIGDNGAGKTSFANCLCGLAKKAEGELLFGGVTMGRKERMKHCYVVMQDVNHQLFTESVEEEIRLSLPGEDEKKDQVRAEEILSDLHLEEFRSLHPMSLSGGQKQRVAIAGALASDKEILVYDEPTSGLDYGHMLEVAENLKKLSRRGKTQFVITHDPELIRECCNYFLFLKHGEVLWSGGLNEENKTRLTAFFSVVTE